MPRLSHATRRLMAAAIVAAGAAGCGRDAPSIPLFPASGRILVGDEPASGVEVRLFDATNVADPDRPHPFATADADGRFNLGTFEPDDGAPAGRYKVMLLWPEGTPGPGVPRDRLGRTFTDPSKSPFEATVSEDHAELPPIVIDPAVVKKAASKRPAGVDPVDPSAAHK